MSADFSAPENGPSGGPAATDTKPLPLRLLQVLILAVGAFYVAAALYHGLSVALFPYDLNYGEGYVLNDALRLIRGELPYTDVREFPMVRSPYPPLFLLVDGLLTQITGPSFAPGRLLSLGSALVIAALLFFGVARPSLFLAAVALALYLGSPHLYQWIAFSRVDLLANAFSLAAVVVCLGGVSRRRIALAATLCVLALATKQTAIAAPAAIALFLAVRGAPSPLPIRSAESATRSGGGLGVAGQASESGRRTSEGWLSGLTPALSFVVLVAVPIVALSVLLAALSGGQFLDHVLLGNASNPFNFARLVVFQTEFLTVHSVLVAAALAFAVKRRTELPSIYAATSFVTTLAVGNEGSSINYFLEFLAAAILAAGWAAAAAGEGQPARRMALALLIALQLGLMAHVPNTFGVWVSPFPPHGFTPTAADYEVGTRLDVLLAVAPGDVLLEPAGFAVRNGRTVWVQPIDLRAEQHRGRWSSEVLNAALQSHRFSLVVLSYGFLPADVVPVLEQRYRVAERLSGANGLTYTMYRPVAS